jgi:ABC-type transporter Mla MlaB component
MVMLLLSLPLTGPSAACTRRLDLATAPRLAEVLEWLSRADTGELYVDTAELTFCDCAGLSVLLAAVQRRQAHGGRLVLTNAARSCGASAISSASTRRWASRRRTVPQPSTRTPNRADRSTGDHRWPIPP